jgi:hypothetical protein
MHRSTTNAALRTHPGTIGETRKGEKDELKARLKHDKSFLLK